MASNHEEISNKLLMSPRKGLLPSLMCALLIPAGCGDSPPSEAHFASFVIQGSGPTAAVSEENGPQPAAEIVVVRATAYRAGAVTSIEWRGKEFINSYDPGRLAQYAWQYGSYGECANPTEAGASTDPGGSSSRLRQASADNNILHTIVSPASWLACGPSIANDELEKFVSVANGLIRWQARIGARSLPLPIRIEAPTIYLPVEFQQFFSLIGPVSRADCIRGTDLIWWPAMQGCDVSIPIIAATSNGDFAIGLYAPAGQGDVTYGFYHLDAYNAGAPARAQTKKIGVHLYATGGQDHRFEVFAAVGTLQQVISKIQSLQATPSEQLLRSP